MDNTIVCKTFEELESEAGQIVSFNSFDEWLDDAWLIVASYSDPRGRTFYRLAATQED